MLILSQLILYYFCYYEAISLFRLIDNIITNSITVSHGRALLCAYVHISLSLYPYTYSLIFKNNYCNRQVGARRAKRTSKSSSAAMLPASLATSRTLITNRTLQNYSWDY